MNLIEELKRRQGGMSQAEFARLLVVSEASLSRIYSGERQIGEVVARKIAKRYPRLQMLLADFLFGKGTDSDETAQVS